MIQLLFTLIFAEMTLIVMFAFKTPFRKLGLDRVKRGRCPIVVKTVAGTFFAVMVSSGYYMASIHRRWIDDGDLNTTDQILLAEHLLEASLMGFSLFLAFLIDKLHHYIRELRIRRKSMEAVKKQNRAFEDGRNLVFAEIRALEQDKYKLNERMKQLELKLEEKWKVVKSAEPNVTALKKQSEGFLIEYNRLLDENQKLRSQLQSLHRKLSHSHS